MIESSATLLFLMDCWSSSAGGIQTVNRELCKAVAAELGERGNVTEVVCLVPNLSGDEKADAKSANVTLVASTLVKTSESDDRLITQMYDPSLDGKTVLAVIGHSKFTGKAAINLRDQHFPEAATVMFVHMDPQETEDLKEDWLGASDSDDLVREREQRAKLEVDLAIESDIVFAVGPRLRRKINDSINAAPVARETLPKVIEFLGGMHVRPPRNGLPEQPVVMALGRTDSLIVKGIDIFTEAAGSVVRKWHDNVLLRQKPEPQFVVRGAGDDADTLQTKLRETAAGVAGRGVRVQVKPYVTDERILQTDLRGASVVIMPSRAEGFGLVTLEAISCGVPIIASRWSGVGEMLRENLPHVISDKLLLDVTDVLQTDAAVLSEKILDLLADPVEAHRFGSEIRDYLMPICSWEQGAITFLDAVLSGEGHERTEPETKPTTKAPGSGFDTRNPVFFVPFDAKGKQVVGRESSLESVRDQLISNQRTAIGHTASFQGAGGLGKTQLAVEYAHAYRDEYPNGVIWLNADQDIDAQLSELSETARWVGPQSEHKYKVDVALQRLRTYSECLIIFDNLERVEDIKNYLPNSGVETHILVTSRFELPQFVPIDIDLLNEEQSLKLLFQEAGRQPSDDSERNAANDIIDSLGGLPLIIEMAGAYLRHRPVTWRQYNDLLEQNLQKALESKFFTASATRHDGNIYSTLKIDEEIFSESPLLEGIMDVLTWSGSAPMSISLLTALLGVDDSAELIDALGLGQALRLIQKTPDAERYMMQRPVREVRRAETPIGERKDWAETVTIRLGDWFKQRRTDFADLPEFEADIDHLKSWQEHSLDVALESASRLAWLQAYPYHHRGRYAESKNWLERADRLFKVTVTGDHELEGDIYHDLAVTHSALGDNKLALRYDENALEILTEHLGENHPDTARSLAGIGLVLSRLSDHKRGLIYVEKALCILSQQLDYKNIDTAVSLSCLSEIHQRDSNYEVALKYAKESFEIQEELLGENHPDSAFSLMNIGDLYSLLSENDVAFDRLERALKILMEQLGEQHPQTGLALNTIGSAYMRVGNSDRAMGYFKRCLEVYSRQLGEDHPSTAAVLGKMGEVYRQQGSYDSALEYFIRSADIFKIKPGPTHPERVSCLISTANLLDAQGKQDEAFELLDDLPDLPKEHDYYRAVRDRKRQLKAKPLRKGFRQPTNANRQRKKTRKNSKKKR